VFRTKAHEAFHRLSPHEESRADGRESRESSNANCAKSLVAVRPFLNTSATGPAPLEGEWVRDDSRDSRPQIRV